jgi:hypothetical protein
MTKKHFIALADALRDHNKYQDPEQRAMMRAALSSRQREIAAEVFDQYEDLDRVKAWEDLHQRALDTSRPFHAYDCAHAIAGEQVRK